ncbi:MAG TPA: 50S ribosomal protein L24 [Ktedonobacterales bacterium]
MATQQKEQRPLHLAQLNIKKGDTVLVLAGKDRGKRGTVSKTLPRQNKIVVEGLNLVKHHVRAGGPMRQPGIVEKAMPLQASNAMVVCTECGEPTRIAHDRRPVGADQKERVVRVCKHCGKVIQDHARS